MAYSVVGGPALGFDLARLSGGAQVAGVLRLALAAGPNDLDRLAGSHPGAGVREEWRRAYVPATDTESVVATLPLAGAALEEAASGETALLRRLETSLLGDAHALDRMVRRDLLDWTWLHSGPVAVQDPAASLAADVLADAATSAYLRDRLAPELRRAMAAPFVKSGLAGAPDLHTGLPGLDERLATFAAADEEVRRAWRRVVDEQRVHTAQWAPAMHQATWALSLSERLRPACDAQLAGVMAFARAGFTGRDAAYGVWNAWSGVVQASLVTDLLPADDATVLLRVWNAVHASPAD
ncbi:hypothetical protein [Nocardioides sp. YIM 152315]|uniref:hypothetical protein n=1 Tax=Nocardioides sp. YIM 152315 TaxID=3031760 RepID=UPI0023DB9DBA|nr:hypothetical protein [Nocardioides sp. YIM 152315]MDF1602348.1 hypothetical protein [Nocardioides sp. YIM 152315]